MLDVSIKTNVTQLKKKLKNFEKKQIPFATSVALNQTGQLVLKNLQRKAKSEFEGGATPSTLRAFKVPKSLKGSHPTIKYSTKRDLTTIIKIPKWAQQYLKYQIDGGVRKKEMNDIFVPTTNVNLNKFGNIPGKKGKLAGKMKNTFIGEIKGIKGLWKRTGQGGREVKLLIAFEPSATYNKKYDYYDYTKATVQTHFDRKMRISLAKAIRTAK